MLGDQAVAQRRRMAVIVNQVAVEMSAAFILHPVEQRAGIQQLTPGILGRTSDLTVDTQSATEVPHHLFATQSERIFRLAGPIQLDQAFAFQVVEDWRLTVRLFGRLQRFQRSSRQRITKERGGQDDGPANRTLSIGIRYQWLTVVPGRSESVVERHGDQDHSGTLQNACDLDQVATELIEISSLGVLPELRIEPSKVFGVPECVGESGQFDVQSKCRFELRQVCVTGRVE